MSQKMYGIVIALILLALVWLVWTSFVGGVPTLAEVLQLSYVGLEDNDICWEGSISPRCVCSDNEPSPAPSQDDVVVDDTPQPAEGNSDNAPHMEQNKYKQSGGNGPENKGTADPIANQRKAA